MFEHPEPRTLTRSSRSNGHGSDCLDVDVLLEPYADGELDETRSRRVAHHLVGCADCAEQLRLTERVRTTLRALPQFRCPPHVAAIPPEASTVDSSPSDASSVDATPSIRDRIVAWLRPDAWRPPMWAATAAVAMLSLALGIGFLERPMDRRALQPADLPVATAEAAQADVAQAEAEVKLALAYLGRIGERTGDIVAQDVLETRVAVPIVRSVRAALAPTPAPASAGERQR